MKKILVCSFLAALVFVLSAQPQEKKPVPPVTFGGGSLLSVTNKNGDLIVRIDKNGRVVYGENYAAATAAKEFWQAVAKTYPENCVQKTQ